MDRTNGFEIRPGFERMMVDVVTGFSTEPGSGAEAVYEQYQLNRPANSVFVEPLDLSGGRPEHQKYFSERERLKTFEEKWKPEYHVTKEDLAQEGFIYKGPKDRAMCVFCLKSIKNWEQKDVVSGEHKRLFPTCPWVRGRISYNIPISETRTMKKQMGLSSRQTAEVTDMAEVKVRLATFRDWPQARAMAPNDLAKAGYFYDDNKDILTCFHCGMKAPGWVEETEMKKEHAEKYSTCPMSQLVQSNGDRSCEKYTEGSGKTETLSEKRALNVEENSTSIEEDMNSPAVLAVLENFQGDYSMDEIRKAVQSLRISKGSGTIKSGDILAALDPDFAN